MKSGQRVRAGIVLLIGLVGLASPGFAQLSTPQPSVPQPSNTSPQYAIQPGDVLDISVLGEPAVSGSMMVSPDGKLTLHMAGDITAAGLTLPQLTGKITEALKPFVRDPQVIVTIRTAHRLWAYALGRIARPGAYEIDRGWTVSQLVAVAGGPASGAALSRSLVMRNDKSIPVDLEALIIAGNPSANIGLEPGDVVIVPETKNRVLVMGSVAKPGSYTFTPGDRLVDVLSAAGGPTADASTNEIGVVRQAGQKSSVVHADLEKFYKSADIKQNVLLQADDIVFVPERAKGFDWEKILNPFATLFLLFK